MQMREKISSLTTCREKFGIIYSSNISVLC